MKNITIVNYGVGNIFSISQALSKVQKCKINLVNDRKLILSSDYLILPGVGAFGSAISRINELGLNDIIQEFAQTGKPVLGICLGMQLLADLSFEFGKYKGLGLISGNVESLKNSLYKTPVIGWYENLSNDFHSNSFAKKFNSYYFYFVHSFQFIPSSKNDIVAVYRYHDTNITSIVQRENIIGVQFHPEKSGEAGLSFIDDFLNS